MKSPAIIEEGQSCSVRKTSPPWLLCQYQPDAEWEVNTLPFGSAFWKDEMPAIRDVFDRPEDMGIIHAMFGLRLKIWNGEALNQGNADGRSPSR